MFIWRRGVWTRTTLGAGSLLPPLSPLVVALGSRRLYPPSHLTSPKCILTILLFYIYVCLHLCAPHTWMSFQRSESSVNYGQLVVSLHVDTRNQEGPSAKATSAFSLALGFVYQTGLEFVEKWPVSAFYTGSKACETTPSTKSIFNNTKHFSHFNKQFIWKGPVVVLFGFVSQNGFFEKTRLSWN